MAAIIVVLIVGVIGYFWLTSDPKEIKERYKGKNVEQKNVIRYFLRTGCMARTMKDDEYETLIRKKVDSMNLKQRALDKHGLDLEQIKEIDPISFEGFVFDKSYSKKGTDGLWRASRYQVSWIFFSDNQVYFYQYTFNMDDDSKKESTDEYFYKDIVNFSTISETEEVELYDKNGNKTNTENIDTTMFQMVVPGDKVKCSLRRNDDEIESILKAMKNKLREKKN